MKKVLLILGAVLAIVASYGGVWWHGDRHGRITTEARYTKAENDLRSKLAELRKEANEAERKAQRLVATQRREADDTIRELKEKNAELREWWSTTTPTGAVDYAYGVLDDGQ